MKEIKISIVIPVYNVKNYLSTCLDSVINQSYSNLEIILVDDGSTDNSGTICDDYAKRDNRIIVCHQKNSGVSLARNNGIAKAKGEYICFIDADDIVHPDYIKKLVSNLDSNALTICQIEKFQNNVNFSKENTNSKIELDQKHFIELCNMSLLNTPCCKLYQKSILKDNKIAFDTTLSLGEDLLFNLNYLKYIDRIIVVAQKLYYYRRSDNNTLSMSYYSNIVEIQLLLYDSYTKFFANNLLDKEALCTFDSYRFSTIMVIVANEFANGNIGFWQRYFNTRRILGNSDVKARLKAIHYAQDKLYYFLIRHRLLLMYKVVNKIKKIS